MALVLDVGDGTGGFPVDLHVVFGLVKGLKGLLDVVVGLVAKNALVFVP